MKKDITENKKYSVHEKEILSTCRTRIGGLLGCKGCKYYNTYSCFYNNKKLLKKFRETKGDKQ